MHLQQSTAIPTPTRVGRPVMRLLRDRPERLATVSYQAAARGGGTEGLQLAVERLPVDSLPAGCDAILVAGDLQGIAPSPLGGPPGLLGIAVADDLETGADTGLLPPPDRVGILLTATCTRPLRRTTAARRAASSTCGWRSWRRGAPWSSEWPAITTR
jgi:hypothetical protein